MNSINKNSDKDFNKDNSIFKGRLANISTQIGRQSIQQNMANSRKKLQNTFKRLNSDNQ